MANSRQERKAQTRARILRAAGVLFRKKGFENAKTTELANRVGVSHGTIFAHFDSKASILRALVVTQMHDDLTALRNLQFHGNTAREKLKSLAGRLWLQAQLDPDLTEAYCSQSWTWSSTDEDQYQILLHEIIKIAKQIIQTGIERGEISSHLNLALTLDLLQAGYLDNLRKARYLTQVQDESDDKDKDAELNNLLQQFNHLIDYLLPVPDLATSDYSIGERNRMQA